MKINDFDFTDYETTLLWDMVSEVGKTLFLKYACKTERDKKLKHFYGWICQYIRQEIDRRMEQDYTDDK